MANFFSSANVVASPAPGFGGGFAQPQVNAEQARMQGIASAFTQGHWVVSFPWGANSQEMTKDGSRQTKHLLKSQKGVVGYSTQGNVFGVIRAEGFLVWKPGVDAEGNINVLNGSWQLPTACRKGDDNLDALVPGAKTQGMHQLIIGAWRGELKKLAGEFESMGNKAKAEQLRKDAAAFGVGDAFGKEINFNLPIGVPQLQEMKAQGQAQAAAEGINRKTSKMTFNCIMAVTFGLDADGEFKMRVVNIIDAYAPVMTIPSGEFQALRQDEIMTALMGGDEAFESVEDKAARLEARAEAITSNSGKASKKRKDGQAIKVLAAQVGCEYEVLKAALVKLGGHLGAPEGLRKHGNDVAFLKAYIANGEASVAATPEASIVAGAQAEATQSTNKFSGVDSDEIDASDIDVMM